MAELEIHHESEHAIDPAGQRVGILAAVLALALAVVGIASQRTHSDAILQKSAANDAWAHYQAGRVKYHDVELGEELIRIFSGDPATTAKVLAVYESEKSKYDVEDKQVQASAQRSEEAAEADERRAVRYDLGEGLLEIGLVLSSLYFIARKKIFPAVGALAGLLGTISAIAGLMV